MQVGAAFPLDRQAPVLVEQGDGLFHDPAVGGDFVAGSAAQKPEDLTLGKYWVLLHRPEVWKWLDWPFEQTGIVDRLRAVGRYRNEIAHWNIDAPENESKKLADARELLDLLKLVTPAHGRN
ncbi:hypothetical protein [Nocardia sp. NPDC051833]|uniref:hypothetical protein n=1 Tax=Nocardia sp. NPDC051833 TaxID=3155674 RepID=UPI003418B71B